jgi:hypothetical protein
MIHFEGKILCSKNCRLIEYIRLLQTKVQDWGESTPNMTVFPQLVSDTTLCCMAQWFCVPQKTVFVKEKFFNVLKLTLPVTPECSFQKKFCSKWKHYGNYCSPTSETLFSCYWVAVFTLGFVSENLNLKFIKMDKSTNILLFQCDHLHKISSSNWIGSFLNSPQSLHDSIRERLLCVFWRHSPDKVMQWDRNDVFSKNTSDIFT